MWVKIPSPINFEDFTLTSIYMSKICVIIHSTRFSIYIWAYSQDITINIFKFILKNVAIIIDKLRMQGIFNTLQKMQVFGSCIFLGEERI